jgi:hypothetical protein
MPKLNAHGEWCAGLAGGTASAIGHVLAAPAGQTSWINDDHVVYNHCTDKCRIMLRAVFNDGIAIMQGFDP